MSDSVEPVGHPLTLEILAAEQRWDDGLEQLLVVERHARLVAAQRYEAAAALAGPVVGDLRELDQEAAEIGAALGLGPMAGSAFVTDARLLCTELRDTLEALRDGLISAPHAQVIARAVAHAGLDRAGDLRVQEHGLAHADERSAHQLARELDRLVASLTEADTEARAEQEHAERRVTRGRGALLLAGPAETQQAIWQAVCALGDRLRTDQPEVERTADQSRYDAVLGAVTGDPDVDAVPVTVAVTMSSDTLLALAGEPGTLTDAGQEGELLAPALARRLAARSSRASRHVWSARSRAVVDSPASVHVAAPRQASSAPDPSAAAAAAGHCAWPDGWTGSWDDGPPDMPAAPSAEEQQLADRLLTVLHAVSRQDALGRRHIDHEVAPLERWHDPGRRLARTARTR